MFSADHKRRYLVAVICFAESKREAHGAAVAHSGSQPRSPASFLTCRTCNFGSPNCLQVLFVAWLSQCGVDDGLAVWPRCALGSAPSSAWPGSWGQLRWRMSGVKAWRCSLRWQSKGVIRLFYFNSEYDFFMCTSKDPSKMIFLADLPCWS